MEVMGIIIDPVHGSEKKRIAVLIRQRNPKLQQNPASSLVAMILLVYKGLSE